MMRSPWHNPTRYATSLNWTFAAVQRTRQRSRAKKKSRRSSTERHLSSRSTKSSSINCSRWCRACNQSSSGTTQWRQTTKRFADRSRKTKRLSTLAHGATSSSRCSDTRRRIIPSRTRTLARRLSTMSKRLLRTMSRQRKGGNKRPRRKRML